MTEIILYYFEYERYIIIYFFNIVRLQHQIFETMNYKVIESIKFDNGKLLVETSEAITTHNNNSIGKSTKIQNPWYSNI